MEPSDRQKIIVNLVRLIKIQNPNVFYTELIARNVFTPEMLDSIMCEKRNQRDQAQKVFLETCKRGPEAFNNLVESLKHSGHISEARLLDPNGNFEDLEPEENFISTRIRGLINESAHQSVSSHSTNNGCYEMSSRPRGFALILNMIDFDGNPKLRRNGAEIDSANMKALLETFQFEVQLVINPKKKNLLDKTSGIIKEFIDKFSVTSVDCCIVTIMSHGEDNFWVQTSDCESMSDEHAHLFNLWEDIFPRFNNQHFPAMRNKPKIFIIQSCRGDRLNRRIRVSPVPSNSNSKLRTDFGVRSHSSEEFYENHPQFNHMMILQSTIPGYVSIRHEELGSPFIRILCQTIKRFGKHLCWNDLVTETAKRLQELQPEDGGPQTCTSKTVGYVRKFMFN